MEISPNMAVVLVALIGLMATIATGVIGPRRLANDLAKRAREEKEAEAKQKKEDRDADWARKDAADTRSIELALALLASNERIAEITFAAGKTTQGTLDIIHKLVNSKLTEEKQERYEILVKLDSSQNREVEWLREKGQEVPEKLLEKIRNTRHEIEALGIELVERRKQQALVDVQVQNLADQLAHTKQLHDAVMAESLRAPAPSVSPAVKPTAPHAEPTVEAPVRVIVPGTGEVANSTVERK